MDLVLLLIELKKLACQGLKWAGGISLATAILNLSLGASILLAVPNGYASTEGGRGRAESQVKLIHMQLWGGLVHLHDPGASPGLNHPRVLPLPDGVSEQEDPPDEVEHQNIKQTLTGFDIHLLTLDSSESPANFWQDLAHKSLALPDPLTGLTSESPGRLIAGAVSHSPDPFLFVPSKPPIS